MNGRAIVAAGVLVVLVAGGALTSARHGARQAIGPPRAAVLVGVATRSEPSAPGEPTPEPRWGRAEVTWDPERYPPNRADWSDVPADWELRAVNDVPGIPAAVRSELERLDCALPRYRRGTVETGVIWGQFEAPAQRDLAVLCVHADKTSATYIFWAGDPARRDVMPQSGSAITAEPRAHLEGRLDHDRRLDPDMPASVDHDGLEIGCCECCSTIFYRHRGRWFTLPGAD